MSTSRAFLSGALAVVTLALTGAQRGVQPPRYAVVVAVCGDALGGGYPANTIKPLTMDTTGAMCVPSFGPGNLITDDAAGTNLITDDAVPTNLVIAR